MKGGDEGIAIYRDRLIDAGVLPNEGKGFSLREGERVFYLAGSGEPAVTGLERRAGRPDQDPGWLGVHRAVYRRYPHLRVLVQSHLPFTVTAAKARRTVPPLLDDFAQIVGVDARVASLPGAEGFTEDVVKGMHWRNAVLIPGWGGLCGAGTFDDAMAVAQVLEKGCRAQVETAFFGGGHRIGRIDAWLMRLVYRYKYSKTAV
jgi:L-fuculose-phosphate aldolase